MKKKILVITKYFPPEYGGIEILAKNMCELLSAHNNFLVDVLCFSKIKSCEIKLDNYKIYQFKENINIFSTPISFNFLKFILKEKKKYDIIHIFTPNPLPSILFAIIKSQKILITWGSDIINQKILKLLFNPLQNFFLRRADKIVCLSSTYREHSNDLKNFYDKTEIIPPFIKNKEKIKKKTFEEKKINILSVGRLVDYKGYETSILTLKLLPKNYNLTIVGSGKRKNFLENIIKSHSLHNRVKILTNIGDEEKLLLFKNSDIFLQSSNSRAESFGISILEAISLSMPLIISNVEGSGMNDMIINGFNGFKFKKNDPEDCANKICLINKENFYKFSENSLKLFNEKFNFENIKNQLIILHEQN